MDCANCAGGADFGRANTRGPDLEPRCMISKRCHEPALSTSRRVRGMSSWFAGVCIANPN
jgi:hypothetical protein